MVLESTSNTLCNSNKPHNSGVSNISPTDLWPAGYYFWHGSAGKYCKFRTITRGGVGVHYVTLYKMPMYNILQPLPGRIQTNNRAGIYAIVLVVQNTEAVVRDFFHT